MIGRKLLRILYSRRVPASYYEELARHIASYPILLDAGGATGLLYNALSYAPSYYIVLDVDEKLVSRAARSCSREAVAAAAEAMPLRSRAVGAVILHDSLHHFNSPLHALEESARIALECIYIRDHEARGLGRLLAASEKMLGFPANFLKAETVAKILEKRGFKNIAVWRRGFTYTLVACRGPWI